MKKTRTKQSYTVPCATVFRTRVLDLAERKGVNVADLARSVTILVPKSQIDAYPDPGEPMADDRETVVLKSGPSTGKPWRRKPRLQVRMPSGQKVVSIRKSLALALAIDAGEAVVGVTTKADRAAQKRRFDEVERVRGEARKDMEQFRESTRSELARLRGMLRTLAFEPVEGGVTSIDEALYVMGFSADDMPDRGDVRSRFRSLATVYHPDSGFGDHERMAQLNSAQDILMRNVF